MRSFAAALPLFALPLFVLLAAMPAAAHAQAPASVAGNWRTPDGKAIITIAPCGSALCGKVARVLDPNPKATTDIYNPDPALRKRPIIGMPILSDFMAGKGDWRGKIYDPKSGKTYRSILKRKADGTLSVKGCIAFFCQEQLWKAAG